MSRPPWKECECAAAGVTKAAVTVLADRKRVSATSSALPRPSSYVCSTFFFYGLYRMLPTWIISITVTILVLVATHISWGTLKLVSVLRSESVESQLVKVCHG